VNVHVKVCGVTRSEDATACVQLGARSIGLNFVPASPRCVTVERAREIARAVHAMGTRLVVVGVVANLPEADLHALVKDAELDCLQLHGDELPDALLPFLPHAYKAVRIATAADVDHARRFPGEHLLVDAKVEGALGGTGASFDWSLVTDLARERKLTLAGGLKPENVADAVRALRPYCVDVASGVESAPGVKDLEKVRAFITNARSA